MTALEVQVGSTLISPAAAMRVEKRVNTGWAGRFISLTTGKMAGTPVLLPDAEISGWRHVPFEWAACPGGTAEERYVWGPGCRTLVREERPVSA